MLTLEILFAVLHGLPPSHLTHLERPWHRFCLRIHRGLMYGKPPLEALQLALQQATVEEQGLLSKALS